MSQAVAVGPFSIPSDFFYKSNKEKNSYRTIVVLFMSMWNLREHSKSRFRLKWHYIGMLCLWLLVVVTFELDMLISCVQLHGYVCVQLIAKILHN